MEPEVNFEIEILYDYDMDYEQQNIPTQDKIYLKNKNFEDINEQIEESIKKKETFDMFLIDPPWDYNCTQSTTHHGCVPYPVMSDE